MVNILPLPEYWQNQNHIFIVIKHNINRKNRKNRKIKILSLEAANEKIRSTRL
jgi:hypothetical protein